MHIFLLQEALKELSEKGWVKSNRAHSTGIGKTLEDYLNITEKTVCPLKTYGVGI